MKKIFRLSAVMLLVMALLVPMFAVPASAATRWNGTSVLKSGKSYVITSSVTMDSKMTIPAKTTLTISNGGSLTISKGVTATVNGTLSVAKGGTLKVNGTLNAAEDSSVKIAGKFTYTASAKIKLNGSYSVTSTGTVSGSGTAEINLSAKSQYNSDMDKINTYLEKKNYSKACSLLEHAIGSYPEKKTTLQKAYSSAVIDWADQYADSGDYTRACSVLNSAKAYLFDTSDVTNRYNYYQGYIPVPLVSAEIWEGDNWTEMNYSDNLGNEFRHVSYCRTVSGNRPRCDTTFRVDGKFTNLKATLACGLGYNGGEDCYLKIYVDDMLVYESEAIYKNTKPFEIDVDITGAELVRIMTYGYSEIIVDSATFYKQ